MQMLKRRLECELCESSAMPVLANKQSDAMAKRGCRLSAEFAVHITAGTHE